MVILSISVIFPISASIGTPSLSSYTVEVGDSITVSGDHVTSGGTVNLYWDVVEGPHAKLIGTTTASSIGEYSKSITVPDTSLGSHYIWVKDVHTGSTARSNQITVTEPAPPPVTFTVNSKLYTTGGIVKTSGYTGETVVVKGTASSSTVLKVYWDYAEGPNAHYLESTTASSDAYAYSFSIPSSSAGSYYVWVKKHGNL